MSQDDHDAEMDNGNTSGVPNGGTGAAASSSKGKGKAKEAPSTLAAAQANATDSEDLLPW